MNEHFRCGDSDALVAYLYGEGEPSEREAVAAHIARCLSCAEEIESLRGTRALLGAWTPPDASLGFRITAAQESVPSNVLKPAAWWRQPLPAWAQAAAAVLIFAVGMTVGGARDAVVVPPIATTAPAAQAPSAAAQAAPVVSRADLARLEDRLRSLESARVQTVAAPTPPRAVDEAALFERVEDLIAASEDRQNATISLLGNAIYRLDLQQRGDMQQVANRVGVIHDRTERELARQNNAIVVLTSLTTSGGAGNRSQ
jgi:anti-sigma factor RsiW